MDLNDLLLKKGIDPEQVLVLRHRPPEPRLNKVLPWLAEEKPEVFNAYQQTQTDRVEKALQSTKYVASFIGHEPGKALFVGLYSVGASRPMTRQEFWQVPAYIEMKEFGLTGFTDEDARSSILWFDLSLKDFRAEWKGKLIVSWPPPEISWWRRAHNNSFSVLAVLEESALAKAMPKWDQLVLEWNELRVLPNSWKSALEQWRGIYYIYDTNEKKGYVGSAYGQDNLLGRWMNYAASGDGGNKLLRQCDRKNFQFSILQLVAQDMEQSESFSSKARGRPGCTLAHPLVSMRTETRFSRAATTKSGPEMH